LPDISTTLEPESPGRTYSRCNLYRATIEGSERRKRPALSGCAGSAADPAPASRAAPAGEPDDSPAHASVTVPRFRGGSAPPQRSGTAAPTIAETFARGGRHALPRPPITSPAQPASDHSRIASATRPGQHRKGFPAAAGPCRHRPQQPHAGIPASAPARTTRRSSGERVIAARSPDRASSPVGQPMQHGLPYVAAGVIAFGGARDNQSA
jgi:hypothetical protein